MEKRDYWAWLASNEYFYFDKIQKILKVYGTAENLYNISEKKLMSDDRMSPEDIRNIVESRDKFNKEDFYEKLKEKDIKFVTVEDEDYPKNLKPYDHRPYYLFYKGSLPDCNKPIVAMVGARACSGYGRNMAKKLAEDLSKAGVQIISGMARGIDTYSQLGAIVGETATFSVVGTGVDVCYPTENIELYNDILKKGGIISEYPPGSKALAWHFPQRNRIISGLSDKVVVVEAKEKSGSLITVEWALEQGRDVMAVPGRVGDRLSGGTNRLIKNGAGIVTSANDIISELKYFVFNKADEKNTEEKILEKEFLMLYSELGLQPKNIYELMENTGLKYEKLVEMLLQLQLKGLVEQPSYNYYSRLS